MKVTFLTPPTLAGAHEADRVFGCNWGYYPIPNVFLLTAAATLEREGHDVAYVDAPMEGWSRKRLIEFFRLDTSDVYLIYTVYLSRETDLIALHLLRERRGAVPFVFLGTAPTETPSSFLVDSNTFVVRGEPEMTLVEMLGALSQGKPFDSIAGLSYSAADGARHNPPRPLIKDLDALPFPARRLIEKHKMRYYNPKIGVRPFTAMLASRGCSYRCKFCVPCASSFAAETEYKRHFHYKPPVRERSVDNVIAEARMLRAQGYRSISFVDDQFVWGEDRALAIAAGLKELGLEWGCLARADRLTEPVVKAFADSGCRYIDVGVESFQQAILDDIRKDMRVETAYEAIALLKKHGITCKINLLIGASPLETEETIRENMRIVRRLRPDSVMYNIANPFPGTDFHDEAKRGGFLAYEEYKAVGVQKESLVSYPHLSRERIEQLTRRANLAFFLSPSFFLQNLKKIRSFSDLIKACQAYWRKLYD
ncbi:MAG: radical SAM protein [Candidatus Sumerlaeota bacterium]|nr:radical SAM protein [Candidatus Sumerlaeota bacterium]